MRHTDREENQPCAQTVNLKCCDTFKRKEALFVPSAHLIWPFTSAAKRCVCVCQCVCFKREIPTWRPAADLFYFIRNQHCCYRYNVGSKFKWARSSFSACNQTNSIFCCHMTQNASPELGKKRLKKIYNRYDRVQI